jgi:hypothetical protein
MGMRAQKNVCSWYADVVVNYCPIDESLNAIPPKVI